MAAPWEKYQKASAPWEKYAVRPEQITPRDVTQDMSTGEKVLAGIGKGFVDTGRGIGQMLGLVPDNAVAEARKLDENLSNTGAGKTGEVIGNVALALPTAFIPGANTLRGAALIGAVQGGLQPVVGDESRIKNAAIGGAAGAGGIAAGRALMAGAQGAKALVEPFTSAGREKIAGRMLTRFADDAASIANVQAAPTMTGAKLTLAESTKDAGIARLQDALRSVDPQINNRILSRLSENNAARVNTLAQLAGTDAERAAAVSAREAASAPLYQKAFAETIDVSDDLAKLLNRPSVQKALSRAQNIAAEEGRDFGMIAAQGNAPAKVTGQTLQDIKMALDAALKDPTSGIVGKEAANVKATRDAIVAQMEKAIPDFRAARTTYAAMSQPLNAMDVGEVIARRGLSNTSDLAGNPRMQANALLGMLRDEPKLINQAIGKKGISRLDQVFTPDQLAKLNAVAGEVDNAAAVAAAGAGPGSATAQRMASQNILRQLIGPTGLPESWAESALANTVIGKPFNLIYGGVAEPKIQQVLADAVLDPVKAQQVLQAASRQGIKLPDNLLTQLLSTSARNLPASVAVTRER